LVSDQYQPPIPRAVATSTTPQMTVTCRPMSKLMAALRGFCRSTPRRLMRIIGRSPV
jgi:hypothetical protein